MSAAEPVGPPADGAPSDLGGASRDLQGMALAERIAQIASDRKAIDIKLIDLRGLVAYTDTLVVCTGNTERQTKAIHDAVHQELKDSYRLLPRRVEGDREARWILMDYLDCVAHVFTPDARAFYRIEQLWGEAPVRAVE